MKNAYEKIAGLTYGCELEYEGISQATAAKTVAEVTGGRAEYEGYHLNNWVVTQPDGRKWQVVSDASLYGTSAEVVTPILRLADMENLQAVVRALRRAGAKVNNRTGLHVHVGAKDMTPAQLKNLARIFYKQEDLILKAAGTQQNRINRYTRKTDHSFLDRLNAIKGDRLDMMQLNIAWFGHHIPRPCHYDEHRYRALNLNNIWNDKHTVEFRFFEGTTHAGIVRSNVLLALTLVAFAKEAKNASAKNQRAYNEASAKYDFRVFLLRLGWIGEEFKNPRAHLMANLPGDAAFKAGRPVRPNAETANEATAAQNAA